MARFKKWIKLLFFTVVAVIVFIAGFEFAAINRGPVTVNYLLGTVTTHLVWVVFFAFCAGILLTAIILGIPYYITRVDLSNLRREVRALRKPV
ncbi:MAG: LapA family protein [Candidatus Competibacteraceae bacterium]